MAKAKSSCRPARVTRYSTTKVTSYSTTNFLQQHASRKDVDQERSSPASIPKLPSINQLDAYAKKGEAERLQSSIAAIEKEVALENYQLCLRVYNLSRQHLVTATANYYSKQPGTFFAFMDARRNMKKAKEELDIAHYGIRMRFPSVAQPQGQRLQTRQTSGSDQNSGSYSTNVVRNGPR